MPYMFVNTISMLFSFPIFCLSSQFSCLASVPSTSGPTADNVDEENTPQAGLVPWAPGYPGPDPGVSDLPTPRHRSGPMLILRLFVTENYELRRIGPCVITAGHRVYVEVCVCVVVAFFSPYYSDL